MSTTCSLAGGSWSWDMTGGEPVQVGFDTWLRHYYPGDGGGFVLPEGMSKGQALVIFVLGGFPQGNTIGLTQATWDGLPPL